MQFRSDVVKMDVSTRGLARISAAHPWRMLGLWLVILVLAAISAPR
jgi:hypothetical protein